MQRQTRSVKQINYWEKKQLCIVFLLLFLCGCAGRADNDIQPSAVPQKWITKTAIVPSAAIPTDVLPAVPADPWQYCATVIVSGPTPEKVSEIENEEFRRRVRITFMIQEEKTETSYVAERCMNGKLYACLINGLSNCAEKLDFEIEPNESMKNFCADPEKDGAILSPAVTGINSPFEWRCHEGTAVVTAQIAEPDLDGYDKSIWFEIPQPEES